MYIQWFAVKLKFVSSAVILQAYTFPDCIVQSGNFPLFSVFFLHQSIRLWLPIPSLVHFASFSTSFFSQTVVPFFQTVVVCSCHTICTHFPRLSFVPFMATFPVWQSVFLSSIFYFAFTMVSPLNSIFITDYFPAHENINNVLWNVKKITFSIADIWCAYT